MAQISLRKPAVAGQFYPSSASALRREIESFVDKKAPKQDTIACMLPHAGYMYSGRVAVETLSGVNIKEKVILLGPNHTGAGPEFSIMTAGSWETPLGTVEIDSDLAGQILKNSKYLQADTQAHAYEHCLEVELPILQYFKADFKIVPMILFSDDTKKLKEIGSEIANTIKELNIQDSTLVLASSDMTHYESQRQAEEKDGLAIKAILDLDEDKLMEVVRRFNITMCGVAPVVTMLKIAKSLNAHSAKLVKYQTSGDTTGDKDSVVGYAGITIN